MCSEVNNKINVSNISWVFMLTEPRHGKQLLRYCEPVFGSGQWPSTLCKLEYNCHSPACMEESIILGASRAEAVWERQAHHSCCSLETGLGGVPGTPGGSGRYGLLFCLLLHAWQTLSPGPSHSPAHESRILSEGFAAVGRGKSSNPDSGLRNVPR